MGCVGRTVHRKERGVVSVVETAAMAVMAASHAWESALDAQADHQTECDDCARLYPSFCDERGRLFDRQCALYDEWQKRHADWRRARLLRAPR